MKTRENTNETVAISKIAEEIQEKNRIKQIQETKRKLWCDVYVAYVGSSNSTKNNARTWADEAVKEFEERFNQ